MIETFCALLCAHVATDFLFQTRRMALAKAGRAPGFLAAHLAILAVLSTAAIAPTDPAAAALPLAIVVLSHLAIDLAKSLAPQDRLWPFMADQGAHLAVLVLVAALWSGLWAAGYWAGVNWLPGVMVLLAGLVLATRAGGFAVGLLMRPWADVELPTGLPQGGTLIGMLERGLIFILVLAGQPGGIGFLIAAKSVLRFEATSKDQRAGEYVIIGTLASFGWALAASYATLALLAALPDLGILPARP